MAAVLEDAAAFPVDHNQGSGTRFRTDRLLGGPRPPRCWKQPAADHAVAAGIAQGHAAWGMAIRPVVEAMGLRFLPVADEHYNFAVWQDLRDPEAMTTFEAALEESLPALVT